MSAMAKLRPHVDAFFDKVTVNVDDKALRENRLKLLNEIRDATRAVADFSRSRGSSSFRTAQLRAAVEASGFGAFSKLRSRYGPVATRMPR